MCCTMSHSEDTVQLQTLGFKKNAPMKPPVDEKIPSQPVEINKPKESGDTKIKRGRGRPRTKPLPDPNAKSPSPIKLAYLPSPPNPNLRKAPSRYMSYWNAMTEEMRPHVQVRVYRNWPSIDRTLSGEKNSSIAIIDGGNPFGQDWEKGMLDYYGCGDYTLYMLEQPTGAKVCMTTCELGRDFQNHPPILNMAELMQSDPTNASYISFLKNRNLFDPAGDSRRQSEEDEKQKREDEEEMNAVEKLTDTVIELSKQNQQRPQQVAAQPVQHSRSAEDVGAMYKDAAQSYKESASASIELIKAAAMQSSTQQTDSIDPIKQFGAVIELTKSLKGDDSVLLTIMKQSEDRAARAEERSNQLLERLMTKQEPTQATQPKSFLETLREHQEINELMGGKKRRKVEEDDEDDDEKKPNPADSFMGLLVSNLPIIAPMVQSMFMLAAHYGANAMYNAAVAKTGVGTPTIPTAPPQAALPQQPQPNPQPPVPEYTLTEEQKQFAPFHPFVAMMQPAIIKHLMDESLDGYTFAQWLIESSTDGRSHYDQLRSAGKDNISLLMKSYPPLWTVIAPSAWRLDKMIDEFVAYDETKAAEEGEDEEEDEQEGNEGEGDTEGDPLNAA